MEANANLSSWPNCPYVLAIGNTKQLYLTFCRLIFKTMPKHPKLDWIDPCIENRLSGKSLHLPSTIYPSSFTARQLRTILIQPFAFIFNLTIPTKLKLSIVPSPPMIHQPKKTFPLPQPSMQKDLKAVPSRVTIKLSGS